MLPPEAIEEFKKICREVYGEEIDNDKAILVANRLVRLFGLVYSRYAEKHHE